MSDSNLKIEKIAVSELIPYARNARTHTDAQVAQIAASIKEFGFNNPVLIDSKNGIIAGHGRVLAARKLGLKDVPCARLDHLNENQKRAFILADNKLALNAGWDEEMLSAELKSIQESGFDLDLTGFDLKELGELPGFEEDKSAVDAEPQIDKADELREKWGVETGQLWELGDHRLLCGDSTKAEDAERVLGGVVPLLMVTDPPYGVEYDPQWRHDAAAKGLIGFPAKRSGKVENDDRVDWTEAWQLFPGDVCYVWHASLFCGDVIEQFRRCKFTARSQIIWGKDSFSISRGHYHWQHESAFYFVKDGKTAVWIGDHSQSTLWKINKNDGNDQGTHGTQKPVECMARPIRNHDSEFVYEPFSGSGTTIIACEQLNRKCRAIEISPAYVAVALQRWADATGKTPEILK